MIVGITGILGAGKTTVARMFKEKGAIIIDADRIGWKVLEQKRGKIIKAFGLDILKERKIDRKKLRKIVFGDEKKLEKLNKITHPSIIKEIKRQAKENKNKTKVIDVALYDKLKIDKIADKKITVNTNVDKICERLLKKYKKEEIMSIMKTQKQSKRADYKIDNNFSLSYTEKQVNAIWQHIK